jgi:N-acetylmuramoyl-L-alanine amidase
MVGVNPPDPQGACSLPSRAARALVRLAVPAALLAVGGCASAAPAAQAPLSAPATHAASTAASPSAPVPSTTAPTAATRPLAGKVIAIDPGHNGGNAANPQVVNQLVNVITESKPCDTTGTETDAGYTEHAFNFDVAVRLARLLRAEGATVVLTRSSDTGVGPCITQRAAIGNDAHAAAAISIHADGGPPSGSGFDIIEPGLVPGYTNAIVGPSARLGLDIRNAVHRITGEPYADYVGQNAIDVRTDLGGLNLSKVPKVFIECGNMRNAADAAKLTSAAFRSKIASALAAGFTTYLTGQAAAGG